MTDTNELVIPVDMQADKPTVVQLGWAAKAAPAAPKEEPKKP